METLRVQTDHGAFDIAAKDVRDVCSDVPKVCFAESGVVVRNGSPQLDEDVPACK